MIFFVFKDGYVLGIARIGGHVAGGFLGPIAVEAGMAKAAGTIAKIRGLGALTFTELEEINLARALTQQEFQDEFAHAEQLLQEAAEKGQVTYAITPDGLKIPVKMEGEIAAEQAVIARMEGEAPKAGGAVKAGVADAKPVVVNWAEVEEVTKHNSAFKAQAAEDATRIHVEFLEDKTPHIFEAREGHLPDTPESRSLLLEVASDPNNYFSKPDKHGNIWCEKFLDNGAQLWISMRNNKIRNGGINFIPIKWNEETGLASLTLPK